MEQLPGPEDQRRVDRLTEPDIVHQASGMISVRDGVSCDAALDSLARYAAVTGHPLPAVCAAVVEGAVNPDLDHDASAPQPPGSSTAPGRDLRS